MQVFVNTEKNSRICTLAKGGVLILLYASTLTRHLVQSAESRTQSAIPWNLSTNHSNTVSTTKSLGTIRPTVPETDSPSTISTEGYSQQQLSFESVETIAGLGDDAEVFTIGTIIKHIQISHKHTLSATEDAREEVSISLDGSCCITNLSFAIMSTVVSEYTGKTYNVKHYNSSYQAITLGNCASLGVSCSSSGTCQVTNRILWIAVEIGNGSDTFVPVSVPSHCYCRYL